ncbi:Similar to hypothetical protein [Tuber melanosporum Mel28]; acc. no. XP_002835998 [Pyronema omphalodes CBS 100304]|uniref:Uncharacterized protein n=1 Tax=Pyronema omphalodes (strain CBS 100304) TaxID=1076935 RepID=U4LT75_PYROM|nr:Similar to hypothetical protein [Tuber melanosporum Mel28]; acc. no. XP_002835998 [Pyronema omphalodes CBS 100304]
MAATSTNPHLTDPLLAPFLIPTFTPTSYLNSILPPLLPPSIPTTSHPPTQAQSQHPLATSLSASALPLSDLSSSTTTLLSTLSHQLTRLLTTLSSLTDDLLRLSPRLSYSIDLLRSDVLSLAEELNGPIAATVAGSGHRPEGLERLEISGGGFWGAMDWSLDVPEGSQSLQSSQTLSSKDKGKKDVVGEVVYLLAAGDVKGAREKVEGLRLLASVFEGTVEGPARVAVVERLDERVRMEEEKGMPRKLGREVKRETAGEAGGFNGLIESLKGLRGI